MMHYDSGGVIPPLCRMKRNL